ncbi:ABC transporter permease [Curtobacterium ammoniigenes]|uniref:ABC transporter permease n=1 Tax=Curtobacterium ammoniigenes TaxID=395387 RepID=UPI00082CDA75|nr:ABC transporter permease [Curtobacterium ammoniigenes]
MRPIEVLASALQGVTTNKLRSVLTLLGVMIGVAAVILLLAVGNGSARQVASAIDALGTNTLTVRPQSAGTGFGSASTASATRPLTVPVTTALAHAGLGDVASVVPEVTASETIAAGSASETGIQVIGTTNAYFSVSTAKVASGSGLPASNARDAVVGLTLAQELFPGSSPIGQQISVGGVPFTIVGELAEQSTIGFQDPNSELIAPIAAVQDDFSGYGQVSGVLVAARSAAAVPAAEGEVTIELNQLLGATTADQPFTVNSPSSLLQTRAASAQSFTVLLAAVAAISLLVGGIGVTNVMLVTVTERTREIGIRKAIGATRGAVLGQFLAEAATLTLAGGVLGVVAAVIGAQFPIDGTTPVLVLSSIPLALGVSVAIGIFFGVYPAARAARMRPIQALRVV